VSIIALSRDYPSVFAQPVIRAVDPAIFAFRYFTHCMSCGFCKDQCCSYGVDIDVENMARLKTDVGFAKAVGIPQEQWFEDEITEDAEFPGGANGRTRAVDGACVFLDRKNRGCRIHAYCLANNLDYHTLKPLVSTLFPVTFSEGVLCLSEEVLDGSLICVDQGPVVYDGVKAELTYYFGADFVAEIDRVRASLTTAAS